MTTTTPEQKIEIMQAAAQGKQIQFRRAISDPWIGTAAPAWNWGDCDYRVKPELREPRVRWFNQYPDGSLGPAYRSLSEALTFAFNQSAKQVKFVEEIQS